MLILFCLKLKIINIYGIPITFVINLENNAISGDNTYNIKNYILYSGILIFFKRIFVVLNYQNILMNIFYFNMNEHCKDAANFIEPFS